LVPQDQRQPPEIRMAGANTVLVERLSGRGAPYAEARAGLCPPTRGALIAPSARSGSLDDVDGGPDGRVYIQMRGIEQVRIRRLF